MILEKTPERSRIFDTEMRRRIGVEDFPKMGWITRFSFTKGINWIEVTHIFLDLAFQKCSKWATSLNCNTFADATTLARIENESPGKFLFVTRPGDIIDKQEVRTRLIDTFGQHGDMVPDGLQIVAGNVHMAINNKIAQPQVRRKLLIGQTVLPEACCGIISGVIRVVPTLDGVA